MFSRSFFGCMFGGLLSCAVSFAAPIDGGSGPPGSPRLLRALYNIPDQGYSLVDTCVDLAGTGKRNFVHGSRATKKLSLLNAADGSVIWSKQLAGDFQSSCIVDRTGSGDLEILYTTSSPGRVYRVDRSGNVAGSWDVGDWKIGNSPVVLDGDGDGALDIFIASRGKALNRLSYPELKLVSRREDWSQCGGHTSALDVAKTGRWSMYAGSGDDSPGKKGRMISFSPSTLADVWSFSTDDNASSADPVLVDLDGDGRVEIVKSVDNYHKDDAHDAVYAFTTEGKVIWKVAGISQEMSPNVADLDGDGRVEIVGMTFAGEVYCLNSAGAVVWKKKLRPELDHHAHMNLAPILCDVDGDKELEIVAFTNGPYFDPRKPGTPRANGIVYVLDARGQILDQLDLGAPRCWNVGFACNIDDNPNLELVVSGSGNTDVITTKGFGANFELFRKRRTYERNNAYPWAYADTYFIDRGTRTNVKNLTDNLVLTKSGGGYNKSGTFTTELLTLPPGGSFRALKCEYDQPANTSIKVAIESKGGRVLKENVGANVVLSINEPVRLRFELATSDPQATPRLDGYRLTFDRSDKGE